MSILLVQGTMAPCYVNILSWDKVQMPRRSTQPIPLYGGMRLPPPRTKTEAIVFAVIVNPEVLRMSGKNAQDVQVNKTFLICKVCINNYSLLLIF